MIEFDIKVVVATQCQLFSLPIIKEAVTDNQGKVVGIESELNAISLNRSIKRSKANLLILTIEDKQSICPLISAVKRAHPLIKIITIALKLRQIPIIIKTRMIRAIVVANESVDHLVQAIKQVSLNKSYYSPKTIEAMVRQIAMTDLTSREKEIQELLDEDRSRYEIGMLLEIKQVTVNTHIRNISIKMHES